MGTWVRIPRFVYERLAANLEKAAGHKYLKKVPAGVDPRTGKQRWRYLYRVTGGKGHVAHEDDLVKVGAAFRLHDGDQVGHFHIVAVDGDEVTLVHDETGRTLKTSVHDLKLRLHREHARAIVDERNRRRAARMAEYEQAKKTGTPHQAARAKERARAAGAVIEDKPAAAATRKPASQRSADKALGRRLRALTKEAAAADGDHAGARFRRTANVTLLALRLEGGRGSARDRREAERVLTNGVEGLVNGTPQAVDRERARERIVQEEAGTVPEDAPNLTGGELEATVDLEVEDADEPVVHEEVGEHVDGARRDLAVQRGSRATELKATGKVSKQEVFGRFSLTDHVGNGGTVGGWHVKAWVARFVAPKAPAKAEYVQDYVDGCTLVAKTLDRCKTPDDVKVALEELADWSMKPIKMALGPQDEAAVAALTPPGHRFVGVGYDYRMGRVAYFTPVAAAALGDRFVKMLHKPSDAMRRAFSQARQLDRTATDAQAYAAAHARTMGYTLDQARTLPQTVRAGGRVVDGVTTGRVTGEAVADHFGGIKNIDYGNWMSNADRDQHLRDAAGALADLADLLGVSDSAVAVGGNLAIGFGSRGRGGSGAAAAHYEAAGNVINLTKFSGGGSLAHEFGHFLDHVAAGNGAADSDSAFGSNSPGKLPPATAGAMRELTTALDRSDFARHARALDEKKKRAYWSSRHEMFARLFESWTEDTLGQGGRKSTYLVHGTQGMKATGVKVQAKADPAATAKAREAVDAAENAVRQVIKQQLPIHAPRATFGGHFSYWGVSDAVLEKLKHRSPEVKAAFDGYWTARRAETAAGRSGGTETAQPYPQGEERMRLGALVKGVVEAMKKDGVLERVMKAFVRRLRGASAAQG